MKNTKFSKISVLILALSLFCAILAPFSVSAETTAASEAKPEIISQNVQYNEKFSLMYAVSAESVTEGPVTLYLYNENPTETSSPVRKYVEENVTEAYGNLTKDSYIFTTDGVAAYAMATEFYVQAVDNLGNKSDVKKYSVGEYLYERLASSNATVEQRNFYSATLDFGASAQKVIAKETDETKYINNYCYVTSIDGTTVDGFGSGIYPKGSTVILAKDGADKLTAISYDADGGYVPKITADSFTIPTNAVSVEVSAGNRIIYRDSVETFESYDVGASAYFTAEGNFTDKKIADTESDRGKVYSATFASGSYLYKYADQPPATIVSADKATAVELSFDIKVSLDTTVNTQSSQYFTFDQRIKNGTDYSAGAYRTEAHFEKGYLELNSSTGVAAGSGKTAFEDAKLDEWFHVRVVSYKGDTNRYYYINGSDTPFYDVTVSGSAYSGDISTLTTGRFSVFNVNGAGFTLEIDNFFYGYTMDKSPSEQ